MPLTHFVIAGLPPAHNCAGGKCAVLAKGRIHVLTCFARAVLCCAVLCCAVLCCAVLCCAVLCCAVLCTDRSVPNLSYKEVQKVVVDSRCSSYAVQGDDEVRALTNSY
jgi:hypothetical protein